MLLDGYLNKKILVTQTKSSSKLIKKQKSTLVGLGLKGINSSSKLLASKDILGMLEKANHLIKITVIV
jgi:large subunit ribosomal protein L30